MLRGGGAGWIHGADPPPQGEMALPGLEPGWGLTPLDFESSASTVSPEGPAGTYQISTRFAQ
jgi:hypothetical protein